MPGKPMNKIMIEYPESFPTVANMSVESFVEETRWAMAVKLYEMGRLTSGQAAVDDVGFNPDI